MRALLVPLVAVVLACGASNENVRHPGHSSMPIGPGGPESRGCGSDLVCPLGFVCAKRAGAFTGECLRAVDENVAPVEVRHSVDSYGAGPPTCATSSDCPSRFRCDDGRCIR
jgi:Cys-rich repeat protein